MGEEKNLEVPNVLAKSLHEFTILKFKQNALYKKTGQRSVREEMTIRETISILFGRNSRS